MGDYVLTTEMASASGSTGRGLFATCERAAQSPPPLIAINALLNELSNIKDQMRTVAV